MLRLSLFFLLISLSPLINANDQEFPLNFYQRTYVAPHYLTSWNTNYYTNGAWTHRSIIDPEYRKNCAPTETIAQQLAKEENITQKDKQQLKLDAQKTTQQLSRNKVYFGFTALCKGAATLTCGAATLLAGAFLINKIPYFAEMRSSLQTTLGLNDKLFTYATGAATGLGCLGTYKLKQSTKESRGAFDITKKLIPLYEEQIKKPIDALD